MVTICFRQDPIKRTAQSVGTLVEYVSTLEVVGRVLAVVCALCSCVVVFVSALCLSVLCLCTLCLH